MKVLIRHTHRAVRTALLAALLGLALFVSLLRVWLLPEIDGFRQTLEARLGSQLGGAVRIGRLAARLHGFHPDIQLEGVELLDQSGRTALRFGTVRLRVDTFRSLAAGEPRFERVEIVGPKLSIRRRADGSLAVVGLAAGDGPPTWLLADGRFDLRDAEVDWQDGRTGAPPLALGRVNARLSNRGERHWLSAGFVLPKPLGRSLKLTVDATGQGQAAAAWRGRMYVETRGLRLSRIPGLPRAGGIGLASGTADARVWLDWAGRLQQVAGELRLDAPVLYSRPQPAIEHRLALKSLSTRFHLGLDGEGWQLDLSRLRPAVQSPWPETRLAVAMRRADAGAPPHLAAAASYLDLADLGVLVHGLDLAGAVPGEWLRALAPRGTATNLKLFHAPDAAAGERLALCAEFRDLGINAVRMAPGLAGIGGRLCGTEGRGRGHLDVAGGRVDLAGIGLDRPVPLDRLTGELAWRETESAWIVDVPSLVGSNAEMGAAFRFRIALPKQGGSPFLDLGARLTDVDVAALPHYCPTVFMPDTSAWVERSLLKGRIPGWDILFRGYTADYPFYRQEGVFQSTIDIEDLSLRYHPDWPLVTGASLRFEFDGPVARIEASGGRIGAGRILNTHAVVEDTFLGTWIRLHGEAAASLPEILEYLGHSPLDGIRKRLDQVLDLSGDTTIRVDFAIPLNDRLGRLDLAGDATLDHGGVRLAGFEPALEQLQGTVRFTPDGIRAEGLRGRFLNGPVSAGFAAGAAERIAVNLAGQVELQRLRELFPAEFWRLADGTTGYRLDLDLPRSLDASGAPLSLQLQSDLAGLAVDLPAPLGKPAEAVRPLSLEARYQVGTDIPIQLRYAPDFAARLRLAGPDRDWRLEAGDLALGLPLPAEGSGSGFSLALRLDRWDPWPWLQFGSGAFTAAAGDGADQWRQLRLDVKDLSWKGRRFGRLDLVLRREGRRWQGRLDSDHADGEISASAEGVRLDLERLRLPEPAAGAPAETAGSPAVAPAEPPAGASPSPADDIDPARIPPIELRARHLFWREADLGPLELSTERRAHGMVLSRLNLVTRDHRLQVTGGWTRSAGQPASTHIEGKLHIAALGEFLTRIGRGGRLRDTPTDLSLKLDWPGAPHRFDAARLGGEVRLQLGQGSLPGVEPGLGRVIGMLNFNSLWRRLSLDFRDLFGKGLAYDGIAGTFRIREGQAITDGLLVDAVAAKILIDGRVGLPARDLELRVTVLPHTSAALPIAGTLVGGPAVGAAMLLAERLIGDEVDQITASQYAVRGAWAEPQITRIYRNLPLDVLDQAWSGVKALSGFGSKQEDPKE